ncbi:DUF4145 domain-containing protein [Empedobacter sp. UBA7248]|uniref:DUF4145 domain-containing protein n=1 Tax=Empedobacter sp. UBA7248 TaxID=1946448 RepID=UPI0025B7A973|nr:DUF4145 domain-containing protein [Empedobacter sp. UBA7248]
MNRELWKPKTFDKVEKYPCPKCFNGTLKGKQKISELTEGGKEMLSYGYPYGIDNVFCGILKCSNSNCNELISVNGHLLSDIRTGYQNENGEYVEIELKQYQPKFFYPNLRMFKISKEIPKNIIHLIDQAFSLYFIDNNACANKIRTAIEQILDDLNAPRKKLTVKRKYSEFTNLHSRIEHFSKKKPKICKLMMALKIIGNQGSHTNETDDESILDAFEILELLIEITYIKNHLRIESLADSIIKK